MQVQAQNQKNINFLVEYSQANGTCGGVNLDPLTLTVSDFSTVLGIMEAAARRGTIYEFSTTFTEADGNTGYSVDSIGNTRNAPPCYWLYYVQSGGVELTPTVGIAEYVPGNNFRVILRYREVLSSTQKITTSYEIQHLDSVCTSATPPSQLSITTPTESTALDVMEEAVRENGRLYRFSTEYVSFLAGSTGQSYGHVIRQVGGVAENGSCYWAAFVTTPSGNESGLSVPVSAYTLPGDGYTLTLRFVELQQQLTTASTTRSGTKVWSNPGVRQDHAGMWNAMQLLFC